MFRSAGAAALRKGLLRGPALAATSHDLSCFGLALWPEQAIRTAIPVATMAGPGHPGASRRPMSRVEASGQFGEMQFGRRRQAGCQAHGRKLGIG